VSQDRQGSLQISSIKRMKTRQILMLLAGIAIVAIAMVAYYTYNSPLLISASEAKKALAAQQFPIVLDVRTDMEYALGHYPDAVHIPTAKLVDQVERVLPDKSKGILVYCNTGQRSRYAADLLKKKGYETVRYISGPYWSLLR
jgi:phage shock protein E